MSDQFQVYPSNQSPLTDERGLVTIAWNYLFTWLYRKTGGSGAVIPAQSVSVGVSPFSYRADFNGSVVVTGGTVSQIDIVRGSDNIVTGMTSGMFPVLAGDSVVVTFSALPTITFLPSEVIPSEAV